MFKKLTLSILFVGLTSIQAFASDLTLDEILDTPKSITLGDVLGASEELTNHKSSLIPLQFGDPLLVELPDEACHSRWFYYNNKENPGLSFGRMLKAENRLGDRLVKSEENAGTCYLAATTEENQRGISYTLSFPKRKLGSEEDLPFVRDVLNGCQKLRDYAPSPLVYPANPRSLIYLEGVPYQIRYASFSDSNAGGIGTLGEFVGFQNMSGMKPIIMNQGYGDIIVFTLDPTGKGKKDPRMTISLGKVE